MSLARGARGGLLVAGGRQRRAAGLADREHRSLYDRAVLARLDPSTGALAPWTERAGQGPEGAGQRFGALSVDGDGVVAATEREVLRIDPSGRIREAISHPWLCDVHHALVHRGAVCAVATGIDGVVVLDGSAARFRPVAAGIRPPAEGEELRFVERPRSPWHANHAFVLGGALWVTRGVAGDAIALDDPGRAWPIADVVVHDGVVRGDGVWFTAVDGRLVSIDPSTGQISRTLSLRQPDDGPEPLGWCRGLAIVGQTAYVGFTRLRATRARRNLAWIAGRLRGRPVATRRPTRVEAYDLGTGARVGRWVTEGAGLDAVFGIVEAPP